MMRPQFQLKYFVLRYTANVVSGEFLNIGLVMVALGDADFGDVRFLPSWTAVLDFDPNADVDFLNAFAEDVSKQIRRPENRGQLLQYMEDTFSNNIQLSTPRVCVSEDPDSELDRLSGEYLLS